MSERIYNTMKSVGVGNLVMGILFIVAGVAVRSDNDYQRRKITKEKIGNPFLITYRDCCEI